MSTSAENLHGGGGCVGFAAEMPAADGDGPGRFDEEDAYFDDEAEEDLPHRRGRSRHEMGDAREEELDGGGGEDDDRDLPVDPAAVRTTATSCLGVWERHWQGGWMPYASCHGGRMGTT